MDEEQIIEDALDVLRRIYDDHPSRQLRDLAFLIMRQIKPSKMTLDSGRFVRLYKDLAKSYVEESIRFADKDDDETDYATGVFKCLSDFEKCKKRSPKKLCWSLFILCVESHSKLAIQDD